MQTYSVKGRCLVSSDDSTITYSTLNNVHYALFLQDSGEVSIQLTDTSEAIHISSEQMRPDASTFKHKLKGVLTGISVAPAAPAGGKRKTRRHH
jgi:alpha-D-ribose 1-methylphosphonate 5-triphosphate synthase subunit PhnL